MPHWLGSLILIVLGFVGVYEAIADPCVKLRGMKHPLKKWQGRLWFGFFATICFGAGLAILLS